jgi:hypothetical protein
VKLISKGDDQSNQEETTRNQKRIRLKDIQTERIGVNQDILHLNKYAS